jgi:hypothetical protein
MDSFYKKEKILEDGIRYFVGTSFLGKFWYYKNKQHRIGGPAVEWDDGAKWWYLDDKRYDNYDDYIKEIYKRFGVGQVMLIRAKYG